MKRMNPHNLEAGTRKLRMRYTRLESVKNVQYKNPTTPRKLGSVTINNKEILVSIVMGDKVATWSQNELNAYMQHYQVTFSHDGTNLTPMDFWNSVNATLEGELPTPDDLFYSFMSDMSIVYDTLVHRDELKNLQEFMSEFGYEDVVLAGETVRQLNANATNFEKIINENDVTHYFENHPDHN